MNRLRFFLITIVLCLLLAPTANAHGYVVRSIPQDRSTLERPPARLQYWFSEALEPQFSEIKLRDQNGNVLATGGIDEDDDTLLTMRVPSDLPDGAYIVELRPAFASDGHVIIESRVFFVGEEVGGVEGQAASDMARPLEVVWKALLFNAQYLLFGVTVLYSYILVPVWGNRNYPQGLLPPRVMSRLNMLMWVGIIGAVIANIIALLQQTMIFFGVGLAPVLEGNLWNVVRIGSRFGDVWNFRMLALLLVVILHSAAWYYGKKYPRVVRSFYVANTWLIALMIGAQAVNSHAAGSLVLAWVSVMIHWLHTVAVAFWVGGIMALVLVLPVALAPYDRHARWQALQPMMMRFSRYTVGAVAVVIASGVYNSSLWFYSADDVTTTYGAALAGKLLLVALLLIVGGLHHIALRPQLLERFPLAQKVQQFGASLKLEAFVIIIALIATALLSATPIPQPEFLQRDIETPNSIQRVEGYEVQLALSPGGTGINTLDVNIIRDDVLLEDNRVEAQLVYPQRDTRTRWQPLEYADNGLFVLASDAIDQTGEWWILLDIFEDDRIPTRIATAFNISDDATVVQSVSPSWVTLLAAFATLGAVLYVLYPAGRRLAEQLDWSPATLLIAIGVIVITIAFIVASVIYLNQQEALLQQTTNPAPERINTILPDAQSIAVGELLYTQNCLQMQTSPDFRDMVQQLDFLRDEDLFRITERGFRDMPPCTEEVMDTERWQIVNYLRTLRRIVD